MSAASSLAIVSSATVIGAEGRPVRVEIHASGGLPSFTVVGQPDAACREARDRVRAALLSSGLGWPARRITVNLAPSGLRKVGSGLDLAIAVGLAVVEDEIPAQALENIGFLGELGLDGALRPLAGSVPLVDALRSDTVVLPQCHTPEARLVGRHRVRGVLNLGEVVAALKGDASWPIHPEPDRAMPPPSPGDLAEVRGQPVARVALEVAAAGGHDLLLVGPPGAGKTMLARRLPGLLPDLDDDEARLATRIHSAAAVSLPVDGLVRRPPLRSPHHSASMVALVGGGSHALQPGELSLAHGGVLFLDELGEFSPSSLDALRQPLEEGVIHISRARARATLPARFLLVGAMNPCPCGEAGRPGACRCSEAARQRYRRRLSGPLLDRFDLRVDVARPDPVALLDRARGEASAAVAERVRSAREVAASREVRTNAELAEGDLDALAPLDDSARALLGTVLDQGRLSARGLSRVRRVALTFADLAGTGPPLGAEVVSQALALRADPVSLGKVA